MKKADLDEKLLKYLIKGVKDYAIFALDPNGIITTWNIGAQRAKGYTAEEIIGKHFSTFYTEEAKKIDHPAFELAEAIKNGSYEEEGWRVRKDGTLFWAHVTITALIDETGELIGFAKVTRDLTERKKYEEDLKAARDQAVLANQLKTRFVANITHEIRTPLSGIIGLSELIADNETLPKDTQDSGERIFDASKNLLILLNDLLDFAKLEAGKIELEDVPFTIEEVFDEVRGLSESNAKEKGLSVSFSFDKALGGQLHGDYRKLRQILLNLVNNSIKFTSSGGIEVSVEKQEDIMLFAVTDTGMGISKDIQESLFKPFAQGHNSDAFGGTGLGLSICQQFVELLGGEIGMESKPMQGTTIWFTLPIKDGVN